MDFKEIYTKKYNKYKDYLLAHLSEEHFGLKDLRDKGDIKNYVIKRYPNPPEDANEGDEYYTVGIWTTNNTMPDFSYNLIRTIEAPASPDESGHTDMDLIKLIDELIDGSSQTTTTFPDGSKFVCDMGYVEEWWNRFKKFYLGEDKDDRK